MNANDAARRAAATATGMGHRLYSDFVLPSRLPELRRLLVQARDAGYRPITHAAFGALAARGGVDPKGRYLLIRHDIDTDPVTARRMFDVIRGEGAASTFYFRIETFDVRLARDIERGGSEAGYHYEELATLAKRAGGGATTDVAALLPRARRAFLRTLEAMRAATDAPMVTAASHGDFVNRKLGVRNTEVLNDAEVRAAGRISLEAYDEDLMALITSRHSDTLAPNFWTNGSSPSDAIARGEPVVYALIHPRHWHRSPVWNARDDARRVAEGVAFRLRFRVARPLTWRDPAA
ncbi:MAG TPA: hypothetical protein VK646_11115 [Actinomycetota bacterium]|nr:hypothetical protein [Actinomycetota bacterium]